MGRSNPKLFLFSAEISSVDKMKLIRLILIAFVLAGCQSSPVRPPAPIQQTNAPSPEIPTNIFPIGIQRTSSVPILLSAMSRAQPLIEQPSPPPVTFISKVNLSASWTTTPDDGAAGYNLYYGTLSRGYLDVIDAGTNLSVVIPNLDCGTTYYFAATAYDHEGMESDFSKEAVYTVPTWIQMTFLFPVQVNLTKVQSSADLLTWEDAFTKPVSSGAQSLVVRAPIMSDPEFFRAVSVAP
jgi:hypothetical protein